MPYVALDRQILWVDTGVLSTAAGAGGIAPSPGPGDGFHPAPFEVISSLPPLPRAGHLACVTDPQRSVRLIGAAARRAGLHQPVLWLASPAGQRLIGHLDESAVIYHHLHGTDPADENVRALAGRADLVVAPSPATASAFAPEKFRVLADGVSQELFATPAQPAPALPIDRPVAGFHGRIDGSFDVGLLTAVAERLPQWQFLLIGPVAADAPALPDLPNVVVAGPRPHAELPRYSQHWQAAMLLRRRPCGDRLPQQLREYLAVGTPIVGCVDGLPQRLRALICAADDADRFVAGLEAALNESRQWRIRRREVVEGEAWSARAGQVAVMLDELVPPDRLCACRCGRLQQASI
jgi:glycosyltransferase involved in cell wall biosynthesis